MRAQHNPQCCNKVLFNKVGLRGMCGSVEKYYVAHLAHL